MRTLWKKVEHYNSKLITPALILLVGVIIFELFIYSENHAVERAVKIADSIIVAVFVIDLLFLARKSRDVKFFFKNYWLDIIAVFPFVIFFSIANKIYRIFAAAERIVIGQALLHETVEAGRGAKALAESGRVARGLRIAARGIRVVTKSRLFGSQKRKRSAKKFRKKP